MNQDGCHIQLIFTSQHDNNVVNFTDIVLHFGVILAETDPHDHVLLALICWKSSYLKMWQ